MKKIPIVAIVGRANVGKSSLFNAMLGRREAIVAREAGTTRDNVTALASFNGKDFWLVDTAGMKEAEDDFELSIQQQITEATENADVIMVVVEATAAISDDDRRIAKTAHKSNKPIVLVVNKADQANPDSAQLVKLGVKDWVATSTTQNQGISDLLEQLTSLLPKSSVSKKEESTTVALLGRPNVGKSSLFNSLAHKQQALVSSRAGTTRDVNRVSIAYKGGELVFLDTAGIRRSGKIEVGIEKFSVLRSLAAIELADIAAVLIDATELAVQLDQKIAGLVKDAGKGLILVVSKWDLLPKEENAQARIVSQLRRAFAFAPWASVLFTSAETGQNVTKLFELAIEIADRRKQRLPTPALNRWLRQATDTHPPAGFGSAQPRLKYITQLDDATPTFLIFGARASSTHWSYRRYLESSLRKSFDFDGTPIRLKFADKNPNENPHNRNLPKRSRKM